MLAFIDSPIQLVVAAVLILVVFGPQKLPEIMGQIGRGLRDLKKASSEFTNSLSLDHEPDTTPKYDAYNTDYTYSANDTAAIPEERQIVDNGWHSATAIAAPVHGDFAAAALADTSGDYGVSPVVSSPEPAKPEFTLSPPQGETIPREK